MKITEENVIKQLRKRNEKALYFVIDQYGGLIKSIIRKHLSSLEDVIDRRDKKIIDIKQGIQNLTDTELMLNFGDT